MASVDGLAADVTRFTDLIDMPAGADLLGPVPLPSGVRPPAGLADSSAAGAFDDESTDIERVLVRVGRRDGRKAGRGTHAGADPPQHQTRDRTYPGTGRPTPSA